MKRLFFLFLISSIISGCQYEFSEDYFKDIKVTQPLLDLNITNIKNDETLFKPRNIQYNYQGTERNKLLEIRFYIDNQLTQSFSQKSGTFFLDIQNLQDGTHTLKIEYFIKSGTGSLADLNNTESYKVEGAINFKVNKSTKPLIIKNIENKDGSLYVYFKKDDYILKEIGKSISVKLEIRSKSFAFGNYSTSVSRTKEIKKEDLQLGYFKDEVSTGIKTEYEIKTQGYYNESINTKEIDLTNSFTFEVTPIGFDKVKVVWSKHPLYNNIVSLGFNNTPGYTDGYNYLSDGKSSGESIIESNIKFGSQSDYLIVFQDSYPYNGEPSIRSSYYIGEKMKNLRFKQLEYNADTNKIYALEIGNSEDNFPVFIHVLNPSTLEVEKSKFITNSLGDYYGKLTFGKDNTIIIDLNRKALVVDNLTLNILQKYKSEDYNKDVLYATEVIFRDNVIALINAGKAYIYDVESKKLLLSSIVNGEKVRITKSAKYIVLDNKIYNRSSKTGNYELFYKFKSNTPVDELIYVEKQETMFITRNTNFSYGGKLFKFDINSKKETEISIWVKNIDFDVLSSKILIRRETDLKCYNTLTQTEKSFRYDVSSLRYFLINNYLISIEGYYLRNAF